MRRKRRSLRRRITALFLVVALGPLFVSAIASIISGFRFSAREVSSRQQATAALLVPYVSSYVNTVFENLTFVGSMSLTDLEHGEEVLVNACQSNPDLYTEVAVLDPNGDEVMVVRDCVVVPADQRTNRASQEYFFRAQRGEIFIGSVSFSNQHQPLVSISYPIEQPQGTFVIASVVNLHSLWEQLNLIDLGGESYFYIVDRRGNVISYRDLAVVEQGRNVSNFPSVAALRAQATEFSSLEPYVGLVNRDVVATSALIPEIDWAIVVEQPVEAAFEFQGTQFSGYLLMMGIVLVVVLVIAFWLARSIVRPITVLAETATAVAEGDLTREVKISSRDELGSVGDSFNAMTTQLRQVIGGLEERVAERTAELTTALQQQAQQSQQLQSALETQQQLNTVVSTLSVPVIPVRKDVLVVPLVGRLDQERMELMTNRVLRAVERQHARVLLLDLSGVPVVDQIVVQHLLRTIQALKLLGVRALIVGITPDVAQDFARFDVSEWPETWATLQQGLTSLDN